MDLSKRGGPWGVIAGDSEGASAALARKLAARRPRNLSTAIALVVARLRVPRSRQIYMLIHLSSHGFRGKTLSGASIFRRRVALPSGSADPAAVPCRGSRAVAKR